MTRRPFSELRQDGGTKAQACPLAAEYVQHIIAHGTLSSFLTQFDFRSRAEVEQAVLDLEYCVLGDPFMRLKDNQTDDPMVKAVYKKAELLVNNEGRLEKLAATLGGDLWHKVFAPAIKEERFEAMFSRRPDYGRWERAAYRIMAVYGLDYADIEKLRFFVEQVKARDAFPPSLRRMLYIWGRTKKTGKTTCAKMLVATLNGSDEWDKADPDYSTSLANELQIGGFRVPKIASCHCCMMDECFYADMGKTYHDFKRFLTSSGGSARLPYGQEFQWTGNPNYVATSNEPLRTFIKDWNDRRFLSVEFKEPPTEKLGFAAIHELWRDFVVNSTPKTDDWQAWAESITPYSDEEGERQTLAEEYATELRKPAFLTTLTNMADGRSATSPDNQITLKFFVDHFAQTGEGYTAAGRRREIEQAVLDVFGERWNGYRYWRLDMLREQAARMLAEMGVDASDPFKVDNPEYYKHDKF